MKFKKFLLKNLRVILLAFTCLLHAALLFFVVFPGADKQEVTEQITGPIRLIDIREQSMQAFSAPPPRVIPPEILPDIFTNTAEAIAE